MVRVHISFGLIHHFSFIILDFNIILFVLIIRLLYLT